MSRVKQITHPTRYAQAIITPAAGGFDLINPQTGRWSHFPTQRAAKWWASVWSSVNEQFATSTIREIPQVEDSQ